MRYWAYLAAKLAAGGALAWGGGRLVAALLPAPNPFWQQVGKHPFAHDLTYTMVLLGYWLFCAGLLYGIVWDQLYRCRTCLRRLRMPIARGSWTHVLLGPPSTEYICPFGHGTLRVSELQISGRQLPDWEAHADIWTELESLDQAKK